MTASFECHKNHFSNYHLFPISVFNFYRIFYPPGPSPYCVLLFSLPDSFSGWVSQAITSFISLSDCYFGACWFICCKTALPLLHTIHNCLFVCFSVLQFSVTSLHYSHPFFFLSLAICSQLILCLFSFFGWKRSFQTPMHAYAQTPSNNFSNNSYREEKSHLLYFCWSSFSQLDDRMLKEVESFPPFLEQLWIDMTGKNLPFQIIRKKWKEGCPFSPFYQSYKNTWEEKVHILQTLMGVSFHTVLTETSVLGFSDVKVAVEIGPRALWIE